MATINTDSGKTMLIRNCSCGSKVDLKHSKASPYMRIECSECGKVKSASYELGWFKQASEELINSWNRMIERENRL